MVVPLPPPREHTGLYAEFSAGAQSSEARGCVCVCVCVHVCAQLLSRVQLFAPLWTVTHRAPLSMEFSRQEYRSRLPYPTPKDLLDPGIKRASPALAGVFFTTEPPGEPPDGALRGKI